MRFLAATVRLNYQPFILSDDLHTGVAYSWLHSDDPRDDRFRIFVCRALHARMTRNHATPSQTKSWPGGNGTRRPRSNTK